MQISLQRYSDICLSLSGWAFVLAVFFAPFSTASLNTLTILGFVLWFISGRFPQHCRLLARNTICRTLFVFVALLTVSTLWSTTTLEMALDGLKSYRKILFFFAVFGIVWFLPQWKEKILWASLISGVVSALACVCVYLHVQGIKGVIHCFSYSKEQAQEYVKMGYYIGVGGVATFKNAKKLKEVIETIPLEKILLETDCPYMAPEPYRGRRNSSLYLPYVVEKIAGLKGVTAKEVEEVTYRNAEQLFLGK